MKLTLLITIVFTFGAAILVQGAPEKSEDIKTWDEFKQFFNKSYSSPAQEASRKANFEATLKYINDKQGQNDLQLGVNEFSDLSDAEFYATFGTISAQELHKQVELIPAEVAKPEVMPTAGDEALPAEWDWRTHVKLNPAEHQGDKCGCCYAFATVFSVEAAYAIKSKPAVRLSKQEIVDCTFAKNDAKYTNSGCQGGSPTEVYKYFKSPGVVEEKFYSYKEVDTNGCSKIAGHPRHKIDDFKKVLGPPVTDLAIQKAIKNFGPVVVGVDVNAPELKTYKGGVLKNILLDSTNTTHAMVVVGWAKDASKGDYWIVRNSWGPSWGEAGYAKIGRRRNTMGIRKFAVYPIV